ncbi:hypothetical protein Tco_0104852 [Tanacetum coccineum]
MASESTSSQQSQQLIPSSKVNFRCTDSIIGFNNVVALLEHSNELYRPMLNFLSNCCINRALTLQPTAMYMEYLKEFWYTAKVEEETKTITFLISCNDLTLVKPHTITVASFQKPLASKVPLTSHMLKVAKLSEEPEQSLIPPSRESKAPTDLKKKKKRIPPSSKQKSPYKARVILPKKQVVETQHADVTVAIANATKSLVASELAEEQGNQPLAAESEKVLDQNVEEKVKDTGFVVMEEATFKQIIDEVNSKTQGVQENVESPFDTESEIKIIKSYQAATISGLLFIHQSSSYDQDQNVINITPKDAKEGEAFESLSGLRSMPDDDLASLSGFEIQNSTDHDSQEVTTKTVHAFADKPAQSDPLGHLHEELNFLNNKVDQLESSISKKVAEYIQSSIPTIVTDTLEAKLPGLLSEAMNNILPKLLQDSIKTSILESIAEELPQVDAYVQKNLQAQLLDILLKPMMKEVQDKLSFCTSTVASNSQHVQDHRVMFKDMVSLLEAEEVFKKANVRGRRDNIADIVQREQPSAQVVPNEEKALVVHNPEKKKSEGTISMEDDLDDDDLDK